MYESYDEILDTLKDSDKNEFDKVLNDLKQRRETYLEHVGNMISENDRVIKRNNFWYHLSQLTTIIGGTIILPALINITTIPKLVPTILSISIAIIIAVTNHYKIGEHRNILIQTNVRLIQEMDWFVTWTGPYKNLKPGAALGLFLEQTLDINSERMQQFLTLESIKPNLKKDENQQGIQTSTTSQ